MAVDIRETLDIRAPVDAVWSFMLDPQKIVTCLPGASLDEVVDDRTFVGSVKIKVGPITTSYKGRLRFAEVDQAVHALRIEGEGRETGGGTARGTMSSRLRALPDGRTELVAEASVDLTGRIMQVGRGMIQGVSHQLFQQFAAALRARLETPQGAAAATAESRPVRVLPLVLCAVWAAIVRFFRRLFGRGDARG